MTTLYDDEAVEEYEPFPDRGGRGGRVVAVFVFLLAVAVIVVAGAFFWYQRQVNPPGDPGEEVTITVPEGASGGQVAEILEASGVIGDDRVFKIYLRINGDASFKPGDYVLRRDESFAEIIRTLEAGPVIVYERLTVREGLVLDQIAQAVGELPGRSAEAFNEVIRSGQVRSAFQPEGASLEGFLWPETYQVEAREDELAIANRMVAEFDSVAAQLNLEQAAAARNLTPYEAIIVASLIERETRIDEERPMVARVIYNRLQRGIPLQIDATVVYALGRSGEDTRVLLKDLEIDHPYNTYKIRGLPPGPISNFGRASLEAALNPADGPWLYYVVTEPDGRHSFATTLAEHQANIRKAERNGVR